MPIFYVFFCNVWFPSGSLRSSEIVVETAMGSIAADRIA